MRAVLLAVTPAPGWWAASLAAHLPGVRIEILNVVPTRGGACIETVRLTGRGSQQAAARLSRSGLLSRGLVLEQTPGCVLVRMRIEASPVAAIIEGTGIVPHLPISVHGPEMGWLLVGDEEAAPVLRWLRRRGLGARVTRAGLWEVGHEALTHRQHEVVHAALSAGYYDRPRRTSLTSVAGVMGVCKSTASEILAVAESKIMHAYLRDAGRLRGSRQRTGPDPATYDPLGARISTTPSTRAPSVLSGETVTP